MPDCLFCSIVAGAVPAFRVVDTPDGIEITWLGHATFRLRSPGGKTILVDPWVMNNPACPDDSKSFDRLDELPLGLLAFCDVAKKCDKQILIIDFCGRYR